MNGLAVRRRHPDGFFHAFQVAIWTQRMDSSGGFPEGIAGHPILNPPINLPASAGFCDGNLQNYSGLPKDSGLNKIYMRVLPNGCLPDAKAAPAGDIEEGR